MFRTDDPPVCGCTRRTRPGASLLHAEVWPGEGEARGVADAMEGWPLSEEREDQSARRRAKLAALRVRGEAYPNDFRPDARAGDLHARFAETLAEALDAEPVVVAIAGRMMTRRLMGKASFAHLRDGSGDIQIYVRRDELPEGQYAEFKRFDIGDIVAVEGVVFRTRTNELSVKARSVRLLVKSLLPLPEK